MILRGYSASMQSIGEIECLNLQWNRKYYGYGDWEAQILLTDYNSSIKFVTVDGRDELGQVQKIQTKHEIKGDFVLMSGYFLEENLTIGNIVNFSMENSQPAAIACAAVTQAAANGTFGIGISGYTGYVDSSSQPYGTATSVKYDCESLGDALEKLLKADEMSGKFIVYQSQRRVAYKVWRGVDRTGSLTFQQDSPWVISMSIEEDKTSYANLCVVIGGSSSSPTYQYVWRGGRIPSGEQIRAIFLDTRSDSGKTDEERMQEITEKFDENDISYDVDIKVVQGYGCDYLTHFNLGDKCTLKDTRIGMTMTARIVEVREVWKAGKHEVSLVFGNPKKTIYSAFGKFWRWM